MKSNILSRLVAATLGIAILNSWLLSGCSSSGSKSAVSHTTTTVKTTSQTTELPPPQPILSPTSAQDRGPALPPEEALKRVVQEAYDRFKEDHSGTNANYIPYLASVPSNLFAVVIVTADGRIFSAGDIDYSFSIQSCSKVFTLAQVLEESGEEAVMNKIGVEPTGMPFNSITALGLHDNKAVNPLVNAGAIAAVSMIKATSPQERWQKILACQSRFAGEPLHLIDEVYKSEADSNFRNRGIAEILLNNGNLYCSAPEAVDVYTKQCSIGVTAKQLAVMGATLANHGVNPITKERCLDPIYVPEVLAVMTMAGFYDESGQWAYTAGLPAKTGVGGGIVAVVPDRMAIVGFAPPLNAAGNSIRATKAITFIDQQLHLNVFGAAR